MTSRWIQDVLASLPALCTSEEATAALRTTRRTLGRWIAAGRLQAVKNTAGGSSRVLIPRAAIAAFLHDMEAA